MYVCMYVRMYVCMYVLCAGTGKSSIVCAICIGLGGHPKLLGRAKEVRRTGAMKVMAGPGCTGRAF